jgi:hypothetical protein
MLSLMKTGLAVLLTIAATATAAQAFELQGGGAPKFKPTKAQLGIISPANGVCPGPAKVTAWVFSNKPGTANVMLVNKSGGVYGPYAVTTKDTGNGVVMGSFNTGFMIDAPTDTAYRMVIVGSSVTSNWTPLTACL